jgi:hypothetical protein
VNSIADTLTISFGSNQLACAWAVYSYDDVDLSGPNGASAIGQQATSTSLNAQAHSAALNMFADPARSTLAGALMLRLARAVDAGSGLAEIDERQMPGNLGTLETADRLGGAPAASWSWIGATDAAAILLELKAPRIVQPPEPVPSMATDRELVKRFEPIMVMDPAESFLPSDAKRYVEHCALWRAEGPFDDKNSWGGTAGAPFDRMPEIAKGKIAAIQGEPGDKTVDLPAGAPGGGPRERFLELNGWINRSGVPEPAVTAASGNFYADRTAVAALYAPSDGGDQTLPNSRLWYHAEVFRTDKLRALLPTVPAHDLVKVLDVLSNPVLLNYYFFFPMHDEPLAPPCAGIIAREFGGFGGEWQCLSILLEGGDTLTPSFIGVTGRPVAQIPPKTVARINDDDPAGRVIMRVSPYSEAESIAAPNRTMTVLFASKGTHSLYLREGPVQTTYLPDEGPLNCGLSEGPLPPVAPHDDYTPPPSIEVIMAKILGGAGVAGPGGALVGLVAGLIELAEADGFGVTGAPDVFDPPPPDSTAMRMNAVIIRPDLTLFDFGPDQRKWAVDAFGVGGRDYDFMVDRDKQLWWPSYSGETGFRGHWGPRVEKDPFHRRVGMRFPAFWAMFFRALAAGKDAKVF